MDKLYILLGVAFLLWAIFNGVTRIIRAARGNRANPEIPAMRDQLDDLEDDLAEARKRIEVLESIVTDDGHQLRKKIDELDA